MPPVCEVGEESSSAVRWLLMRKWLERVWQWLAHHTKTLDLFPEYVGAVYHAWHDYLWGWTPVAPVIVWWMLGQPPMWLVAAAFIWAFLIASYYAWRAEVSPRFRSWISDMTLSRTGTEAVRRLFVGLRIVNLGPPTSIPTWYASYDKVGEEGRMHVSDSAFVEDDQVEPPSNIRGTNLLRDYRRLETGETREGWVAFDIWPVSSDEDAVHIMQSVFLRFVDAFGKQYDTALKPQWVREHND